MRTVLGLLPQLGLLVLQRSEPAPGQLGPAPDRLVPDNREVGPAAEVLRDGDRGVQIEDDVPPAARHEDGLARLLQDLDGAAVRGPRGVLGARVDQVEPGDGLVPLLAALDVRHFQEFFRRVRREQAPSAGGGVVARNVHLELVLPFVAYNQSIPGARAEGVYVDTGTGTCGSHDEPAVWRSLLLSGVLEEVIAKVNRNIVIFKQFTPAAVLKVRSTKNSKIRRLYMAYLSKIAIKNIQRTVILGGLHVMHVVLHL